MVYELSFTPWFSWDFQAAQCGQLHIEIAHLAGTLADPAEQLQKFFLAALRFRRKLAQQDLKAARPGAETVHALRRRFRGELAQILVQSLENNPAALWRD